MREGHRTEGPPRPGCSFGTSPTDKEPPRRHSCHSTDSGAGPSRLRPSQLFSLRAVQHRVGPLASLGFSVSICIAGLTVHLAPAQRGGTPAFTQVCQVEKRQPLKGRARARRRATRLRCTGLGSVPKAAGKESGNRWPQVQGLSGHWAGVVQVGARLGDRMAAVPPSLAGARASTSVRARLCVLLRRLLCKHVNLFSFCVFFPSQDNWVSLKSWRGC